MQPNRLSVGGVRSIEPVLHRRGQVTTHDFVGCIMELAVNGRPLEPSQALASRGILDRSAPPLCPHLSIVSNVHGSRCETSVHTQEASTCRLTREEKAAAEVQEILSFFACHW